MSTRVGSVPRQPTVLSHPSPSLFPSRFLFAPSTVGIPLSSLVHVTHRLVCIRWVCGRGKCARPWRSGCDVGVSCPHGLSLSLPLFLSLSLSGCLSGCVCGWVWVGRPPHRRKTLGSLPFCLCLCLSLSFPRREERGEARRGCGRRTCASHGNAGDERGTPRRARGTGRSNKYHVRCARIHRAWERDDVPRGTRSLSQGNRSSGGRRRVTPSFSLSPRHTHTQVVPKGGVGHLQDCKTSSTTSTARRRSTAQDTCRA